MRNTKIFVLVCSVELSMVGGGAGDILTCKVVPWGPVFCSDVHGSQPTNQRTSKEYESIIATCVQRNAPVFGLT